MFWNEKKKNAMIEYSDIIREASIKQYSSPKIAAMINGWAIRHNVPRERVFLLHNRVLRSIKK
jgi:hypothetical protein